MSNYEYVRLGDVATYINGYAFKPSDWSDNGLPIIRIQNLTGNDYQTNFYNKEYNPKYLVKKGDVLISWSASLGVYVWQNDNALLNQHIFKVVFDKIDVDKDYFCITVEYLLRNMGGEVHGSTMKHITKPRFDNTVFPLPDKPTQKLIAKRITTVYELIDKYQQKMQKLDELIKSRFVEMFGDINNNNSFSYKPIKSITTVLSGGTPNRKNDNYWKDGTIPWVKTTELNNSVIYSTEEKITELGLFESSAKIVPSQTILIAMYGQGKTRGMTGILGIEACTNQACACILPDRKINQKYLWYYYIFSYDKLRSLAKGGNQPNLNVDIIKNYPVLFPPLNLQNQFADFVSIVEQQKTTVQKSIEKLETLKKSLMQEYFG